MKQDIISKKIEKNYKKINNFISKYLIWVLIILISIFLLTKNISKNIKLNPNENFKIERLRIIGEFDKKINQNILNEDLEIHIINGKLEIDNNLLLSVNNLISYKDFIMPKNVFLYNIFPIAKKDYFKQENYDTKELENFAKNTIFNNIEQIDKSIKNTISLPIDYSIENTFYTNCISQKKLFQKTCDFYTQNFLKNFFIYNLSNDYQGLQEISQTIIKTKYKTNFCDNMIKYVLYSSDTDTILENIFYGCGKDYLSRYQEIKLFFEIQEQLEKGYINDFTYLDPKLNAYKLISYQQILYNELSQTTVNAIRFQTYINYLKSILKNNGQIDSLYLDLTYWFHNHYIINLLNKLKFKLSENQKTNIEDIIKDLYKINNGDTLEGYVGLKKLITNKSLEKISKNDLDIITQKDSNASQVLENLKGLSFLKIVSEEILEDSIKIAGYFYLKGDDLNIPLYVGFILKNIDNQYIINNLDVYDNQDLNKILSELIKQKGYTVTQLYQYIQNNIHLFLSKDQISTCDIITERLENIKERYKQIDNITMMNCDQESINILKEEKIDKTSIKTFYKINLDNFNITEILISDKELENEIRKYLINIHTNHINISNIIGEILLYKKEEKSIVQEGSNNIIMAIEDLEIYLGARPKDIAESQDTIIAEFVLQNINFIGFYDIQSKKLGPLYFKYNKQNDQDENNKISKDDLFIRNFELYLNTENQNTINKFIVNPLIYIQEINPHVVLNYKQLKYK